MSLQNARKAMSNMAGSHGGECAGGDGEGEAGMGQGMKHVE